MTSSKIKIVFYGHCGCGSDGSRGKRNNFTSLPAASLAAEQYSREARYQCEAYQCPKENGTTRPLWHIRAKNWWSIVPTGDPGRQFQASTVVAQLDRAIGTKEEIDALLVGIPE